MEDTFFSWWMALDFRLHSLLWLEVVDELHTREFLELNGGNGVFVLLLR